MRNPGKYLLAAAVVMSVLVAAPLAMGAGEGKPVDGGARNPSNDATQNYTRETEIIANVATYGTRQSNKSTTGGGAIYGCRATVPSTNTCVRASNLSNGQAFSFSTNGGPQVGRIESGNKNAAPFTTNATGVATGLNADKVDGKDAADITTDAVQASNLFATVTGTTGVIVHQRGSNGAARDSAGVYRVSFPNNDVSACAANVTPSSATPATATTEIVNAHEVRVRTFVDGTDGVPAADDVNFNLTVTC
jgi:hypothetical protein